MTLRECYDQMNGSYDDAKARLMMDSMVERFLQKFLEDKTMEDLRRAVASGDISGSFRGAIPSRVWRPIWPLPACKRRLLT